MFRPFGIKVSNLYMKDPFCMQLCCLQQFWVPFDDFNYLWDHRLCWLRMTIYMISYWLIPFQPDIRKMFFQSDYIPLETDCPVLHIVCVYGRNWNASNCECLLVLYIIQVIGFCLGTCWPKCLEIQFVFLNITWWI